MIAIPDSLKLKRIVVYGFFFTGLLLGKLESLELKIQARERERERGN